MSSCTAASSLSGPACAPRSESGAGPGGNSAGEPLAWFADMVDHCYDYAVAAKAAGRPIVGIMCEFTPREIVLAAGGVPICLCGGSLATIPAAEEFLPSNLCPLIKSTFGYHVKGSNPFLEMADLVVAETTCDGKKKMFELMGQSRPMYVLELPQKAGEPDGLDRWTQEVARLKDHLAARFKTGITRERLTDAIILMNRERSLRRRLAELMALKPPPLTGRQLIEFKSIISGIGEDLTQYEKAIALYGSSSRNQAPKTPVEARVLLTGVPTVHGAERVIEIIESAHAVVVCMENCTGLKPILEDVDLNERDPVRAIAMKYYHLPCSVMTPNARRVETLRALAERYQPDCVIELVWQACLTYDVESFLIQQFVQKDLGLPYLKITTDYSPSDSPRIATRVEALVETALARRATGTSAT